MEAIKMRRIKIAQIGVSQFSHGRNIFNSLKKQRDIFNVVGYVLPENEREKFPICMATFDGYRELTLDEVMNNPEIEAVTVETEEIYLTKYALLSAQHGKHIHMEKPGGIELAEFEELIETVKHSKTVFHTGYMYRYNPYMLELMEQIKKGELGEIINVEAQMNCIHTQQTRQWLSTLPGGMMFFLGCHLVDMIVQIQGIPENVIALNKCSGVDGVISEDFGMAVFEYKNGVSFAKTNAVEIGGFARRQLVVIGTKKTVELKPLEVLEMDGNPLVSTERTEYSSRTWSDRGVYSQTEHFDRYDTMMAAFAAIVRGDKESPYTYDRELDTYRTILKSCGVK